MATTARCASRAASERRSEREFLPSNEFELWHGPSYFDDLNNERRDDMSNEHDDDEIRDSIPCERIVTENGFAICVPVGYHETGSHRWYWRGVALGDECSGRPYHQIPWDHAIAREKARRARDGQVSAADKAAAMLAEAIRERDELRAKLERVRGVQRYDVVKNGFAWTEDSGEYVRWDDIDAVIGKDGEA